MGRLKRKAGSKLQTVVFFFRKLLVVSLLVELWHLYRQKNWSVSIDRLVAPPVDLIEQSRQHVEPPSEISAAICYKTLFGDIDLKVVIQWAAYNRLLGFDHIYFFYRPEMTTRPFFEELRELPYVTLTKHEGGTREDYYNQFGTEVACLKRKRFGGKYDWVFLADTDEFLWFQEKMGIKEFLHRNWHLNYLSFGKRMYTLDHSLEVSGETRISMPNHEFGVSQYPFHVGNFCYRLNQRRGEALCPTWRGRSKVIVRPKFHQWIATHGTILHVDPSNGTIHFHPEFAHVKEWPMIFDKHNVTKRGPDHFFVKSETELHVHNLQKAVRSTRGGQWYVRYDDRLTDWFQFVAGRFQPGP